jgi:hypothetical protein
MSSGPRGRWFKSSRPDLTKPYCITVYSNPALAENTFPTATFCLFSHRFDLIPYHSISREVAGLRIEDTNAVAFI